MTESTVATDSPELQALDRARDALRQGDGDTAEAQIAQALTLDPELTAALELRAMIACRKGDFEAGLADFRRLTELEPETATAWLNLGKCQRDCGQHEDALASLGKALELDQTLTDTRVLLGLTQRDLGDQPGALATLKSAVEAAPDNLAGVSALAMQHQAMGDSDTAMEWFIKARNLDATLPQTHYNLGAAQLSAGQLNEAGESFSHALTINHNYHAARMGLAEIAEKRSDPDTAVNIYRRITRRAPQVLHAHVALMRVLANQRRLADMASQLEQCRELLKETDFPAFWQAQLDARRGRPEQALAALETLATKPEPLLDRAALQSEIDLIKSIEETSS